jgi:hypothetical protein
MGDEDPNALVEVPIDQAVGWTYAGEIEGEKDPTIVSMLGWPGPISQYHAANGHEHWITEIMLTGKEPFNAERLLLSTGILNHYMESNCVTLRSVSRLASRINTGRVVHAVFGQRWLGQSEVGIGYTRV